MKLKRELLIVNKVYGKRQNGYHVLVQVLREYHNGLRVGTPAHTHFAKIPKKGAQMPMPEGVIIKRGTFTGKDKKEIECTWLDIR